MFRCDELINMTGPDQDMDELCRVLEEWTTTDDIKDTPPEATLERLPLWRTRQLCPGWSPHPDDLDIDPDLALTQSFWLFHLWMTGPSYILAIPIEVREIIYTFAFDDLPTTATIEEDTPVDRMVPLPPVCFTSTQIWHEAVPAYLRRTDLHFVGKYTSVDRQYHLIEWLSRIPQNQGFFSIRKLTYLNSQDDRTVFGGSTTELYPAGLVSCCPGLRSLVLTVHELAVLSHGPKEDDPHGDMIRPHLKSLKDICDEGQWQGLFETGSLQTLKLILRSSWISRFLYSDFSVDRLWANFLAMVRAGFEKRGRKIDLVVEYVVETDF